MKRSGICAAGATMRMQDLKAAKRAAEGVPAAAGHSLRGPGELERRPSALAGRGGLSDPAQQIVFQEYVRAVTEQHERLRTLGSANCTSRCRPGVVPGGRGDPSPARRAVHRAPSLDAELGDLTRFDNPRQLMSYLGLTPSEYSTGERRRQGGITKTGNTHARRVLVEGAWAYRYPAKVSRHLQLRLEKLPRRSRTISWKAQVRLCKRYRQLDRPRQKRQPGRRGDRPRDGRLRLGHRPRCPRPPERLLAPRGRRSAELLITNSSHWRRRGPGVAQSSIAL